MNISEAPDVRCQLRVPELEPALAARLSRHVLDPARQRLMLSMAMGMSLGRMVALFAPSSLFWFTLTFNSLLIVLLIATWIDWRHAYEQQLEFTALLREKPKVTWWRNRPNSGVFLEGKRYDLHLRGRPAARFTFLLNAWATRCNSS